MGFWGVSSGLVGEDTGNSQEHLKSAGSRSGGSEFSSSKKSKPLIHSSKNCEGIDCNQGLSVSLVSFSSLEFSFCTLLRLYFLPCLFFGSTTMSSRRDSVGEWRISSCAHSSMNCGSGIQSVISEFDGCS